MGLITCPDCGKDLSDQAPTCSNCGRPFKDTQPQAPPTQAQPQVIKKSSSNSGCIGIIFGLIILVVIGYSFRSCFSSSSISPDSSSTYSPPPPTPASHFTIKTNKFSTDEYGYYEVVGEIKNIDAVSFRFVHVKATFLNKASVVVGEDTTYACAEDYILPGGTKSFKFMGQSKPDYNSVRCEVTSCDSVK